jgi:hypothetical protein
MPDDTLLAAARAGRLQDPHNLAEQAVRMLHDPKSSSLVDNFAGQWLYTRAIADLRPDPWLYPDWDDELARDMVEEARTFFQTFLDEQRPLTELFTAQDTTISARLAAHYGVPAPTSNPGPVSLGATDRRGVLGQAGLLAATSYPTRTSPVKRGKFILDQLLCESPKPPPANISGLIEPTADAVTVRQRLEVHRANPGCASCHATMDPLGFGLERYDALGVWRTTDNGAPVDASGLLPDGRRFEGARELGAMIATDPRFSRCATEKLYTYALARQPSDAHSSWITTIEDDALSRGFSLESLVLAIVTSEPFRTRGGAQ